MKKPIKCSKQEFIEDADKYLGMVTLGVRVYIGDKALLIDIEEMDRLTAAYMELETKRINKFTGIPSNNVHGKW